MGNLIYFYMTRKLTLLLFHMPLAKCSLRKKSMFLAHILQVNCFFRNPIAITVRSIGGVSNEIERVKGCALYFKNGGVSTYVLQLVSIITFGFCRALKVARLDFTEDQIIDNVKAVLSKMPSVIDPSAVQSICILIWESYELFDVV